MGRRTTKSSGRPKILTYAFAFVLIAVAIYILSMAWMSITHSGDRCGMHISVTVLGAAVEVGNACKQ